MGLSKKFGSPFFVVSQQPREGGSQIREINPESENGGQRKGRRINSRKKLVRLVIERESKLDVPNDNGF